MNILADWAKNLDKPPIFENPLGQRPKKRTIPGKPGRVVTLLLYEGALLPLSDLMRVHPPGKGRRRQCEWERKLRQGKKVWYSPWVHSNITKFCVCYSVVWILNIDCCRNVVSVVSPSVIISSVMIQQSTVVQMPLWETGICASLFIFLAARVCYAVFEASHGWQFFLVTFLFWLNLT